VNEIVNESLKKAAKGTAIAFAGMLIYMFLEFITRVIIARNTTQNEYGVFSIGFTLMSVFVIISCLGLQGGAARCIAYFRGREENEKVSGVIYSSLQLSITAGLFSFLFVFFLSDFLASLFHLKGSIPLKVFAVAIPFYVIIEILGSIFRGFDSVREKVYFRDFLMNFLKVLLLLAVVFLGLPFIGMIYGYALSIVIASIVFMGYAIKKLPSISSTIFMRGELLLFSLPLLGAQVFGMVIMWMDTLMLGYFKTPDVVGLYNAAHPIAQLIQVFLLSLVLIYIPIASQLYSKNLMEEMRRSYTVLTKWIFSITLPFFLLVFLFPKAILEIVFGSGYIPASTALRILAFGMLIHVFFGPNAATLIVIGRTKLNLMDNLIGAITNVSLNLLLIPMMGIVGAAIASAISFAMINALKSAQIFRFHKVHPFAVNYLKPVVTSTVLISIVYVLVKVFWSPTITLAMLIAFGFLFFAMYGLSILVTKSFDQEDIMMLLELEKMTGMDASWIKRILKRFM